MDETQRVDARTVLAFDEHTREWVFIKDNGRQSVKGYDTKTAALRAWNDGGLEYKARHC